MTKAPQYNRPDFKRAANEFITESVKRVQMAYGEMSIFDKATIEFPTATGKTRIIQCDLLRYLPNHNLDVFCIASHRLMLNVQHIKSLLKVLKHALPHVAFVFVGTQRIDFAGITQSDESLKRDIGKILVEYNEGLDDKDKVIPNELVSQTCSVKELVRIVDNHKAHGRDVIIISTYHSLDKLKDVHLHTIYCDEAHMIAGPKQNEFFKAFKTLSFDRSYFFTGTPKEAKIPRGNSLLESTEEIAAREFDALMDNKEIFGERIKLSIKEAIDENLIVQPIWHVLYPGDHKEVDRSSDLSARAKMVKQCFISHSKWLKEVTADPNKIAAKLLVNCKGVEDIWQLEKETREKFGAHEGKKIRVFAIASAGSGEDDDTCMMVDGNPVYSRIEFLERLNDLADTEYAIVFHFNVLTEGIDVPSMTGVVFLTHGLPTIIKTLQTIGRATRLHPEDRKRLFGLGVAGKERMSFADRDTKWIKPYCAVMIPVLGEDSDSVSVWMKAMIPVLAESVDFENELRFEFGEDVAIGKRIFEDPNELRTGLEPAKAKALLEIAEIREEIQKIRNAEEELRLDEEIKKLYVCGINIDKIINYAKR